MERCLRPIALRRPDSGPPDFDAEITGLGATGLGCAATAGLEGAGIQRLVRYWPMVSVVDQAPRLVPVYVR